MGRNVLQPARLRVPDEETEHAVATRRITNLCPLLFRESPSHELHQPFTVGADHTQSSVARVDQRGGGLDDPAQHLIQVEIGR